ncbi:MAG: hypothetical protein ACFFB3_23765 [Candidatus Hodarchaeota archaeon]
MKKANITKSGEMRVKRLLASMRGIRLLVMEARLKESHFPDYPKENGVQEKKEDTRE